MFTGKRVYDTKTNTLICDDKSEFKFNECIWCTNASAPAWLETTGLKLDRGFVSIRDTLQSLEYENVFAVGDVATMKNYSRPKAGVFAVRQGPPLFVNLVKLTRKEPLVEYVPQSRFLGIISTGNKYAIASRGEMALEGDWIWVLKRWIDQDWLHGYTENISKLH